MKDTLSDLMEKVREERRMQGGFESLWSMPLINEKEIRKLNFKKRLSIRTKLWLYDWYPMVLFVLSALSGVYYILQIVKAL
jgi:hypothetical protein